LGFIPANINTLATKEAEMAIKQPYVVLKQEASISKRYGTPMTKITLLGVKDRREYVTYVDAPNRNHKNWSHIINNPDHGFVLRNIKTKQHKDKELVDADSKPIIEVEMENDQEIMRQVADIWAQEDLKNGSDKFRDLFE
jgi:hypothetical protein